MYTFSAYFDFLSHGDILNMFDAGVTGNHPLGRRGAIHVIKVRSAASPRMGFSIRGGNEYGLGVYVSHVDSASAAGECARPCQYSIIMKCRHMSHIWKQHLGILYYPSH